MSKKDVIDEFYYMAMFDLAHDVSQEDVYDLLKDYESKEMYEQCAGIMRALKTYKFVKDFYTIKNNNDKGDFIQMDFEKDGD
tara:strand:+ start:722 stop:967 length:246 start_codon:yes stop_codon:yes gene_type:complete